MSTNSNNSTNAGNNSLSPFDLSGLGMGFGLYRPRRPSYTFATKYSRQRSESYRYATRRDNPDSTSDGSNGEDFIEGVLRNKSRNVSYIRATRHPEEHATSPKVGVVLSDDDQVEPAKVDHEDEAEVVAGYDAALHATILPTAMPESLNNHHPTNLLYSSSSDDEAICQSQNYINNQCAAHRNLEINHSVASNVRKLKNTDAHQAAQEQKEPLAKPSTKTDAPTSPHGAISPFSFNKNLIVLCVSFILIFSSFRAIQNLQSSMNTEGHLGIITMMVVHLSMILACLLAPIIVNVFTAKWGLCIGILCFLIWFAANFHPTFYTLIPTSFFVGFGQGILWNAESSYILKLAFDSSKVTRGQLDREMFRFHGVFLACFQSTHIWGNLISSLLLSQRANEIAGVHLASGTPRIQSDYLDPSNESFQYEDQPLGGEEIGIQSQCGALHRCKVSVVNIFPGIPPDSKILSPVLWKLMTSYLILGVVSFGLIVTFLDRIGARADPEKTPRQIIFQHLSQLLQHRTLRLLIPLLLFNGMQQGFIYSDYNQYFVTCKLGIHYVGYCMITLGVSTVLGAIFVAIFSHKIPREVVLGFGGIVHIALMIGYLIWIPESKPVLFFVLAAAWGVCDSVWQTQCNTLICLTCTDAPEVAFTNYRLIQSVGLAIMFGSGTWMCVSTKLYLLMTLLVVAIMFYVLAEYRLRHNEDDVFEEP